MDVQAREGKQRQDELSAVLADSCDCLLHVHVEARMNYDRDLADMDMYELRLSRKLRDLAHNKLMRLEPGHPDAGDIEDDLDQMDEDNE